MTDEVLAATDVAAEDTTTPAPAATTEAPASTEAAPAAQEGGQPGQDPAAAAEDAQKKGKSAQERVQQAVARQREAEREAAAWRAKAEALESGQQPDPTAFQGGEFDPQYVAQVAQSAVREMLTTQAQETAMQAGYSAFQAKIAQDYPDGQPAGITALSSAPAEQVTPALVQTLFAMENGHKVADHLGANPVILQRVSALPVHLQALELAKIESSLSKPKAKTITDAPTPAPTVRGPGGQFKVAADTSDFASFERQYLGG